MKIVQKISALVIATAIGVSLISCDINNNSYKDEVLVGAVDDNKDNSLLIDEVEIYKPLNERETQLQTYEDYLKLYAELEIERQHYDKMMKYAYENYNLYTEDATTNLVMNTVKIYYDMASLLTPMHNAIQKLPEETEEEIGIKIDRLSELNKIYKNLAENEHDSMWIWFGDRTHISDEQEKDILLFTDLFNLVERGVGGHLGVNYLEKDIQQLTEKLEELKNSQLGV